MATHNSISAEKIHCIYCKKELDEQANQFEIQNQVHYTCQSAIDYYHDTREKLPNDVYAELQKFFKKYDIVQYRYLTNKELLHVTRLNLNDKKIDQLPPSIYYLANLKELAIAGNNLCELPDKIGLMKQLEVLNLSYNKFESVPSIIRHLSSLKKFYYKGNGLTAYPHVLKNLQELETLDLSHNRLEYLPDEISNLKDLEIVRCKNNKLESLPNSMEHMKKIRILDLSKNRLQNIPYWIEQKKFYYLNLTENPIENIHQKLNHLQSLLLHGVVNHSK